MNLQSLADAIHHGRIEWSAHALKRMLEQQISRSAVKGIVQTGEMIEHYPDDAPFPSALYFGLWRNQPLHVVIAYDQAAKKAFLITAHRPDEKHFEADFKTRRKK